MNQATGTSTMTFQHGYMQIHNKKMRRYQCVSVAYRLLRVGRRLELLSTQVPDSPAGGDDDDVQWMASAVQPPAAATNEDDDDAGQWMAAAARGEDDETAAAAEPEQWLAGVVDAVAGGAKLARDEQVPKGGIERNEQMRIFNKLRTEGRGMTSKKEEERMSDRMNRVFKYRNDREAEKKGKKK